MLWPDPDRIPSLSTHQRSVVASAMISPVWILTGGPGTGKTWTIAAIIHAIAKRHGIDNIAICCPTGKAAVRCTAAMQRHNIELEATTIHRLLGVKKLGHDGNGWGFDYGPEKKLPFRFVIADEMSMCDTDLFAALLSACDLGTHLLIVGDTNQLPPVGHGAPLRDLLERIPAGRLTQIERNAGDIVRVCRDIDQGRPYMPSSITDADTGRSTGSTHVPAGRNVKHFESRTPARSLQVLRDLLSSPPPGLDPVWDVQVLCATNSADNDLGRKNLNRILQDVLNPHGERVKGNPFRVNDKVICTSNSLLPLRDVPDATECDNCGSTEVAMGFCVDCGHNTALEEEPKEFVANGEIGKVLEITPKMAIVEFEFPPRIVKVPMGGGRSDEDGEGGSGCDFDLGYAITTHKSQGSQFPVAIVLADGSRGASQVCSREWWTTAVSRAEKLDITIGRVADINRQCRVQKLPRRKTFLKELLVAGAES